MRKLGQREDKYGSNMLLKVLQIQWRGSLGALCLGTAILLLS